MYVFMKDTGWRLSFVLKRADMCTKDARSCIVQLTITIQPSIFLSLQ